MNTYTKNFIKNNVLEILLSLPKTLWFNLKVLPFKQALRLPFVVSVYVRTVGINRKSFVVKKENLSTASMRIGFGDSACSRRESKKGLILIRNGGQIECRGTVGLSQGVIIVADNARLILGDHFRCNYSTTIHCMESDITFGNEVVCGWNVTVKNNDGHTVIESGIKKDKSAPIVIGDHVWLCAYSTVLKGVNLGANSVVAYGSLLTKACGEPNQLYAGVPAKQKRNNINWEE